MIDVTDMVDYNRTDDELEVFWLFSILVAGKNADIAGAAIAKLLRGKPPYMSPLKFLNMLRKEGTLEGYLKEHRTGQYTKMMRAIEDSANINLRTASVEELQEVYGVGMKTARMFVLFSRPKQKYAVLDVHILKWLRQVYGYEARIPSKTPTTLKEYLRLEEMFLQAVRAFFPGMSVADADLHLWSIISGRAEE